MENAIQGINRINLEPAHKDTWQKNAYNATWPKNENNFEKDDCELMMQMTLLSECHHHYSLFFRPSVCCTGEYSLSSVKIILFCCHGGATQYPQ